MATCENLDLAQALGVWLGGIKLDNYCIYGLSTVWLGRMAKLLALLAAIPLIVDLVGEDRIHKRSQELSQSLISLLGATSTKASGFTEVGDYVMAAKSPWQAFLRLSKAVPGKVAKSFLAFALIQIAVLAIYFRVDSPGTTPVAALVLAWLFFQLLMLVIVIVVVGCGFILFLAILFSAAALRTSTLCWYIRFIAAALLVLSFSIDFFVSS